MAVCVSSWSNVEAQASHGLISKPGRAVASQRAARAKCEECGAARSQHGWFGMGESSASSEPSATRSNRYVSRPPSTPKYFSPATPAYCAGACTYHAPVYACRALWTSVASPSGATSQRRSLSMVTAFWLNHGLLEAGAMRNSLNFSSKACACMGCACATCAVDARRSKRSVHQL